MQREDAQSTGLFKHERHEINEKHEKTFWSERIFRVFWVFRGYYSTYVSASYRRAGDLLPFFPLFNWDAAGVGTAIGFFTTQAET
jgi:hypothetical protein